jgi:hypothetical protein
MHVRQFAGDSGLDGNGRRGGHIAHHFDDARHIMYFRSGQKHGSARRFAGALGFASGAAAERREQCGAKQAYGKATHYAPPLKTVHLQDYRKLPISLPEKKRLRKSRARRKIVRVCFAARSERQQADFCRNVPVWK